VDSAEPGKRRDNGNHPEDGTSAKREDANHDGSEIATKPEIVHAISFGPDWAVEGIPESSTNRTSAT
jgi:hypothetical protein